MESHLDISAQIEALLFFKGEAVTTGFLAKALDISDDEVRAALAILEQKLFGRGIILMQSGDDIELRTTPAMGQVIEALLKEELNKDLGKAGLETLATVLYRGPISRSEINYIRGVNSNYILRALLVRGLIEKVEGGKEGASRSTIYRPTFDLLSYMGVSKVEDLPEYKNVSIAVETFKEEDKKKSETYEEEPDRISDADSEA